MPKNCGAMTVTGALELPPELGVEPVVEPVLPVPLAGSTEVPQPEIVNSTRSRSSARARYELRMIYGGEAGTRLRARAQNKPRTEPRLVTAGPFFLSFLVIYGDTVCLRAGAFKRIVRRQCRAAITLETESMRPCCACKFDSKNPDAARCRVRKN